MNRTKVFSVILIAVIGVSILGFILYRSGSSSQNNVAQNSNNESILSKTFGKTLYTKVVDLDGDNKNETIQIIRSDKNGEEKNTGVLTVNGNKGYFEIPFIPEDNASLGLFTELNYEDLNRDGIKDIFVTVPGKGEPFPLNYFLMYDYQSNRSYYFDGKNKEFDLKNFADAFKFSYSGKGILNIKNDTNGYSGIIDIKNNSNISDSEAENAVYNKSWIDPSPVNISDNSRLMLVTGIDNSIEIKLTIAIYGQSTTDLIGEFDLFYAVNASFKPYLKRFELLDFGSSKLDTLG